MAEKTQEMLALEASLRELKSRGLTFGQCVEAFGEARDESAYGRLAFDQWHEDGAIEIDDTTVVSESSDNGAYVMAWVWVDDPETNDGDQ